MRYQKFLRCAGQVFLALELSLAAAFGQTGVGQIQGNVTDSSGAVVPRAAVSLQHASTNSTLQTTTSESGVYVFPSLAPGEYRITVSAAGMQKWEGQATLSAGQRAVIDATLDVATRDRADHRRRRRDPAALHHQSDRRYHRRAGAHRATPLNGRNIQTLLTDRRARSGRQRQPAEGLWPARFRDGAAAGRRQSRRTAIPARSSRARPGLDTIQEFRVETAVSSAKLTRPASAIMITRSGTNELHGSAFLTGPQQRLRRRAAAPGHLHEGARTWCATSSARPSAARSTFPRSTTARTRRSSSARGKSIRQRQASTTTSAVWTEAMRARRFQRPGRQPEPADHPLRSVVRRRRAPTTPRPRTSTTNSRSARLSPIAKYMFGVTPLPTNNLSPLVGSNLTALQPTVQDQRTFTFRGDHRFSDKDKVFGRFSRGINDQMNRRAFSTGGFPITSDDLYNRETYLEISHTAMASWTHTFSPTLFVENVFTDVADQLAVQPQPGRRAAGHLGDVRHAESRSSSPARRTSTTRCTRASA